MPKELSITFDDHVWSNGFALDQLGEIPVKIPVGFEKLNPIFYISRVLVKFEGATFYVIFNPESPEFPPYRIQNFTKIPITVHQKVTKTKFLRNLHQL